jgi:hypothetical protein
MQVLSYAVLVLVLGGTVWGAIVSHEGTYEDVSVKWHSTTFHSLGYHEQDEVIKARIIVDEGSIKVLEGRFAIVELLDDANKASLERGEGYQALQELVIETKETDVGEVEYIAHASGTYYLAYRNDDWWNLTLKVADGDALTTQLIIKVFAVTLFIVTMVVWAWFYDRLFEVNLRERLGLVRRERGPGSRAAKEPGEVPAGGPAEESDIIE